MKILPTGIAVIEGDQWASRWIEEQGILDHDPTVSKVLEPLLEKGDTVIDVGAMLGAYSFGFKRAVGPRGRVIAYEPNPQSFECLKHNLPDVECWNHALGRRYDEFGLEYWREAQNPGAVRLVRNGGFSRTHMDTLDFDPNSLDRLDLLKIDVEGMEPDVIAGGMGTIKMFRPIIFLEINHPALKHYGYEWHHVIDPLTDMGYKPKFLDPRHNFREQDWSQLDLLMMP